MAPLYKDVGKCLAIYPVYKKMKESCEFPVSAPPKAD